MRLFNPTYGNAESVTVALIKSLKLRVHSSTIAKLLQDHPHYPSLLSISDSLNEWRIFNEAYLVPKAEYDPRELNYPFIAHSKVNNGIFWLIHEISGGSVIYSDETHDKALMVEEKFLKLWDGVALHAIKNENSGEKDYLQSRTLATLKLMQIPGMAVILLACLLLAFSASEISFFLAGMVLLKVVGLIASILLLIHSIDAKNPFIQNLCSLGKKNDCNAILKSPAANLTSWLSWSEVGFYYFSFTMLAILLVPSSALLLGILSILALPYTIYSLTYQYRIGTWCVLCSTVQAILWVEALAFSGLYLGGVIPALSISNFQWILILIVGSLPIFMWTFLKPFFIRSAQVSPLDNQLKKFKFNSELFGQALKTQPRFAVPDEVYPVKLGNPTAMNVITMVSNPFCGPCASAHKTLDSWLDGNEDFLLKIIFTTSDSDDDPKTLVARHIAALSRQSPEKVEAALNDWYAMDNKKYESWALKYPVTIAGELAEVTKRQKAWCEIANVNFTPAILINGYKLPEPYRLEDVKYLLE